MADVLKRIDIYQNTYCVTLEAKKREKNDKLVQRAIEAAIEKMAGEQEIVHEDARQMNKHYSLGSAYNKAKQEIINIYNP